MKRARIILLSLSVLVCLVSTAHAQTEADKATARNLFGEGQDALRAKDCQKAADRFERADKLYQAPTITLGLARAYVCLGKFVKGKEKYNLVIREQLAPDAPDAFKTAQADARKEIAGLDAKIGYVTITVQGPASDAAKVTIDGEEVPAAALGVKRPVDPGQHVITADATGWKPGETTVTITAQQNTPAEIVLVADPNETEDTVGPGPGGGDDGTGDTLRLVGFIALGVGAAGLIVGGVTGGLAIGKHGDLSDACGENGQCPADQQGTLDDYNTFGTVSTIGFIAGGVVAAAGLVLVLVAPSVGGEEAATLRVSPTGVEATIRF
jgi:hypothetical protein